MARYITSVLVLFLLFLGCNPSQKISESKDSVPFTMPNDSPHILSAIINIYLENESLKVTEHQFILKEGYLKPGTNNKSEDRNNLFCEFTTESGQVLQSQWVVNPIHGRLETVNDQGDLITIQNSNDEGTILVRTNFENGMYYLRIYQLLPTNEKKLIESLPIVKNEDE